MTIKEVCDRTGLSRKTIRLYLEKGLVAPASEVRNGRIFRTWSEEDVRQLEMIASLRRAQFTMEEIHRMQENPDTIGEILPGYRQWLRSQKETLESLVRASETLEGSQILDVYDLSEKLTRNAGPLPLPDSDIRPRFRHLDEIEETSNLTRGGRSMNYNDITGGSDIISQENKDRMYRQFVADCSKDYTDNLAVAMGQLQEAMDLGNPERKQKKRSHLSPAVILCIGLLLTLVLVLMIYSTAHPDGFAFSAAAPKGSTDSLDAIEIVPEYLNGYTQREALDAANLILERFPRKYRDCELLALQLVKLHSEMPGHLLFAGRVQSGDYTAKAIGIRNTHMEYTVYWNMAQDKKGRWYISGEGVNNTP